MQRSRDLLSLLFVFVLTMFLGCDREEPAPPAPTTVPTAGPVAPPAQPVAPAEASLPARNTPEDLTVDPDRDPKVRQRAKELNAIAVAEMRNLRVGDEAIVLVRGDRGGGSIYGSGPYTADSAIRKAVVHNGALQDRQLGLVRVKYIKHDGEHRSTPQNGIVPAKWGPYHTSYTIEAVE